MNVEYRDGRHEELRGLTDQAAGDALREIIDKLPEVERLEFFRSPLDDVLPVIAPTRHERRKQAAEERQR